MTPPYYLIRNHVTWRKGIAVALLLLLGLILWGAWPATAIEERDDRILFISSYHPGFPTFFQQIEGLQSGLTGTDIELDVEFMDSKRFVDETSRQAFLESLSHKLATLPPYDVIIVSDDNAFNFALDHQSDLFVERPIVFFGVNDVVRALGQNNNPFVTGVVEAVSMPETLQLMVQLQSNLTTIYALVDGTPSGQADLQTFNQTAADFKAVTFANRKCKPESKSQVFFAIV